MIERCHASTGVAPLPTSSGFADCSLRLYFVDLEALATGGIPSCCDYVALPIT